MNTINIKFLDIEAIDEIPIGDISSYQISASTGYNQLGTIGIGTQQPLQALDSSKQLQLIVQLKGGTNFGSISFSISKLFTAISSGPLNLWFTLFNDKNDDLYDGDFTDSDEERPRIKIELSFSNSYENCHTVEYCEERNTIELKDVLKSMKIQNTTHKNMGNMGELNLLDNVEDVSKEVDENLERMKKPIIDPIFRPSSIFQTKEIEDIKESLSQIGANLKNVHNNSAIEGMANEKQVLQEEIGNLNRKLRNYEAEITELVHLKTEQEKQREACASYETKIRESNELIASINKQYENKKSEHESSIKKILILESESDLLKKTVLDQENACTKLKEADTSLKVDISNLNQEIANKNNLIDQKNEFITSIQSTLSKLNIANEKNNYEMSSLQRQLSQANLHCKQSEEHWQKLNKKLENTIIGMKKDMELQIQHEKEREEEIRGEQSTIIKSLENNYQIAKEQLKETERKCKQMEEFHQNQITDIKKRYQDEANKLIEQNKIKENNIISLQSKVVILKSKLEKENLYSTINTKLIIINDILNQFNLGANQDTEKQIESYIRELESRNQILCEECNKLSLRVKSDALTIQQLKIKEIQITDACNKEIECLKAELSKKDAEITELTAKNNESKKSNYKRNDLFVESAIKNDYSVYSQSKEGNKSDLSKPIQFQQYSADKSDKKDVMLASLYNKMLCPVKLTRISDGTYTFGTKKIYTKLQNDKLIVKIGTNFMAAEQFLSVYTSQEILRYDMETPSRVNKEEMYKIEIQSTTSPLRYDSNKDKMKPSHRSRSPLAVTNTNIKARPNESSKSIKHFSRPKTTRMADRVMNITYVEDPHVE